MMVGGFQVRAHPARSPEVRMGQVGSWERRLVDSLCQSKVAGLTFKGAWALALQDCPPRGRDEVSGNTLFDVTTGVQEVPLVDAMRGYCEDAWFGRKPGLRKFSLGLLVQDDWAQSAQRRRRTAA